MGLYAIPFAINLEKVKAVFGCKDSALLEAIKSADLYENYASQEDSFSVPAYNYDFDKALEDILFHYIPPADRKTKSSFLGLKKQTPDTGLDPAMAHGYGYALLVICDYLGTHLMPHCDGFYYGNNFKEAVAIIKKNGLQLDLGDMFEQHEVFDIPKNNDFPAIKLFTKAEIEHVCTVMAQVEIDESKADSDNDDFDEIQSMLLDIRTCFQTCKDQNAQMVCFTH